MRASRRLPAIGVAAALITAPIAALPAGAAIVADPVEYSAADARLALDAVGTFETGLFDESGAEIVHAWRDRLFVVNAQAGSVSVLDYSDPSAIAELYVLASSGVANSVAIRDDGLGVIAVEAEVKTDPGHLVFFDASADSPRMLGQVEVGALPDNVEISADGRYAVAAIEGEPADDFSTDPEGAIAVARLPIRVSAPRQDQVRTANFHAFEAGGTKTLPAGVRVYGPNPDGDLPVSRNLEPEFVTIDGRTAYVTLQEANAIAQVDLASTSVTAVRALGAIDRSVEGFGIDASDRDDAVDIRTYPGLFGLYEPDGISSYTAEGATYLVTANEGDAREWGEYSEISRVKDLADDGRGPVCADSPLATLTGDADLGRLNVTTELGFDEASGCYDALYTLGGRSFSIFSTDGSLVFDSGDAFEQLTAAALPEFFNSNHSESNFDARSDDKGPEPESVTIGAVNGRTYAFVGFERVGGVAVYDITDPAAPSFTTYLNNRDFAVSVEDADDPASVLASAGDLGPEGLEFIAATESPTGEALLAVANEVSGTTTVFSITDLRAPSFLTAPTITGTPTLLSTLTAQPGTWSPGSTFTYQWLKNGEPIPGATRQTYRPTWSTRGAEISVRVTATIDGAATSAVSAAVTIAR